MYKALKSFSGLVSMRKGEVRDISNLAYVKDLLNAKYIEEVKTETKPKKETNKATKKKK
jgi:hypothetical protein